MKNNLPEYMLIYKCETCGLDSSFTDIDKRKTCYYCEGPTKMKMISKQLLTPEVMADRLKTIADRMYSNLQAAYASMSEEDRNLEMEGGKDMEKEMLMILDRAKEFKTKIDELELK